MRSLYGWDILAGMPRSFEPGSFATGDRIDFDSRPAERISIADIWRYSLSEDADEETKERVAQLSLLPRFWKERITTAA